MHQAIIAKVEKVIPIASADKVQLVYVLGEYCVTSKDVTEGYVGVLFPADLQLSEDYCKENNLYREGSLNKDSSKKGFFDKNRKVRAQKFLKVNSTAYFASLESLDYTGVDVSSLHVMDKFNDLNGHHICKRFESEEVKAKKANIANSKSRKINEVPLFLKHKDTEQALQNLYKIQEGDLLSFAAKGHGTSGRYGYLPVTKTLPKWKQLVNRIVPVFPETSWEYVVGSRNVILKNPERECQWHGNDSFRFEVMEMLKPHLTKGLQVYGEIVGFIGNKPVMPNHSIKSLKSKQYEDKYGDSVTYSYGCKPGFYKFYIYRITTVGVDGSIYEFSQKQMESWCKDRGLETTFEIHPQMVYNGDEEALKTLIESLTERPEVLTEDYRDPSHISEGIVIRVDSGEGTFFLKSKSVAFKICEGIMKTDTIEEMS